MTISDQTLQFIGTIVLPAAGILVAFWIYWRQKQGRGFGYEVVSSARQERVLKTNGSTRDITSIVVRYANTGSDAITSDHCPTGVRTHFLRGARVIDATILQTLDDDPGLCAIEMVGNPTVLVPELFNPGDSRLVEYRVEDFRQAIRVTGKIINVSQITNLAVLRIERQWAHLFVGSLFVFAVIGGMRGYAEFTALMRFWLMMIPFFLAVAIWQVVQIARRQFLRFWVFE